MAIDVNDPSTWPDTLEGLAALALDSTTGEDEPEVKEPEVKEPEVKEPEVKEPEVKEPEVKEPEAKEPEGAAPPADPQILTPDGQQYLPFDVLKAARERNQALEAELAVLKAASAAPPVPVPASAVPSPPAIPADVQAKADKLAVDWNPDIAEMYLDAWRTQQQNQQLQASLEQVMTQARQAEAARAQREEQAIQAAIDSSPLMVAWQSDAQSPYYDRAVALHDHLLKHDATYQRQSWEERFQVLPGKVEALYGASPHASTVGKVAPPAAPTAPAVPTPPAPVPAVPVSLSSIPSAGEAPSVDPVEDLGRMTGPQMQAYLSRLATNPAKLQEYLGSLH